MPRWAEVAGWARAAAEGARSAITDAVAARPPLSYSLPAFHPSGYQNVHRWLDNLRDLAFRWVTLHPTWLVYDEDPLRIRPRAADVEDAVAYARQLGFFIQIEPHLDWECTLTGGLYKWRKSMLVDPTGEYFDIVLGPMADLHPDRLTLGSELDISTCEFPRQWQTLTSQLEGTLGHKLNHDALPPQRGNRFDLSEYLVRLQYVAFSFYPAIEFHDAAGDIFRELRLIAGAKPEFVIGEFGLGSTDLTKPWQFGSAGFQTPEDFALRRDYYLRFLEWLGWQPYTKSPATFWTAGQYDVLGVLEQPGFEAFRDDAIRDTVAEYNRQS